MTKKPSATLPGTVEKIIKSPLPSDLKKHRSPSKGRITCYREIRIDNTLSDENGTEVQLKPGAKVEVTVEAEPQATTLKRDEKGETARAWQKGQSTK
jgi:hypothetical protein